MSNLIQLVRMTSFLTFEPLINNLDSVTVPNDLLI